MRVLIFGDGEWRSRSTTARSLKTQGRAGDLVNATPTLRSSSFRASTASASFSFGLPTL